MSNKKVSEFNVVNTLDNNDLFLINHLGTTSTVKLDTLSAYIGSSGGSGGGSGGGNAGTTILDTKNAASTSSVIFTGIPSSVNRVTIIFRDLSTTGGSDSVIPKILLGTSSGIVTTGYKGTVYGFSGGNSISTNTVSTGFKIRDSGWSASIKANGTYNLNRISNNTWSIDGGFANDYSISGAGGITQGYITLNGSLDRISLITGNETDLFDDGVATVSYDVPTSGGSSSSSGIVACVNFDATKDSTGAASTANTDRLIKSSSNVSSVTQTAVGIYKINFTTNLTNNTYCVHYNVGNPSTAEHLLISEPTNSYVKVESYNYLGGASQYGINNVTIIDPQKITGGGGSSSSGNVAWVNFDGTKDSTGATSTANTNRLIRASSNVSSVLRNGAGDYTITFTSPIIDNNYCVSGAVAHSTVTTRGYSLDLYHTNPQTTTSVRVRSIIIDSNPQPIDANIVCVNITR